MRYLLRPHETLLKRIVLPYLAIPWITALFYILGAVSGPQTEYWWVQLDISGQKWDIGGLGSCVASNRCPTLEPLPEQAKVARDCLRYHLAVAPLVVIAALAHFYATRFQGGMHRLTSRLLVPPLVFLFASTCWMADILVVYSTFKLSSNISNVVTKPSYWLSTAGFTLTIAWLALADFYRRCKDAQYEAANAPEPRRRKRRPPTTYEAMKSWWPWAQ